MNTQHKVGFAVIAGTLAIFAVLSYARFGTQAHAPPASLADPHSSPTTEVHKRQSGGVVQQPVILQADTSQFDALSPSLPQFQQTESPYDYTPSPRLMDSPVPAESQRPSLLPDPFSLERDGGYERDASVQPALQPPPAQERPAEFGDDGAARHVPPASDGSTTEFKFEAGDEQTSSRLEPLHDVRPATGVDERPTRLRPAGELDLQPIDTPTRTQVVLPNDSFWLISERAYGTSIFYKALYHHNRNRFPQPDHLPAGTVVDVPPPEELRDQYPELCLKR